MPPLQTWHYLSAPMRLFEASCTALDAEVSTDASAGDMDEGLALLGLPAAREVSNLWGWCYLWLGLFCCQAQAYCYGSAVLWQLYCDQVCGRRGQCWRTMLAVQLFVVEMLMIPS